MRKLSAPSVILIATCLVFVLSPLLASADVVHLRTGEAVKGRTVQERSTEAFLTIEDYLTGALRRVAWDALDTKDRDRIQLEWGWTNTGQTTVMGERLVVKLDDGSTTEERGVVEWESNDGIGLLRDGTVTEVKKIRVVDRDDEEIDVRDVWTAEQLVDRLLEAMKGEGIDLNKMTSQHHWRIATYAEWALDLDRAKEYFARCTEDDDFLKKGLAEQRLARVTALLLDQEALDTLREARFKLRMSLFRRVKQILDGFEEAHPNASADVLAARDKMRALMLQKRTEVLQRVARLNFVDVAKDMIHDKLREDDIAITDVTSWCRRELPEAVFTRLATRHMHRYDDVTPEEAKTFWEGRWEGRRTKSWKKASYGGGTFIVNPPKIKPPKARGGGRGQGRGGGGGARVQIPKPPTRDQWWGKAGSREREQWVLAYFAERSELFEVAENYEYKTCTVCNGSGLLSKTLQTGATLSYLCTRCGGAMQDVIVKFR